MKTILLFGHGGYYNRGCEAIVRSTVSMLRKRLGDIRVILASYNPSGDADCRFSITDDIIPHMSPRWSTGWALARGAAVVRPQASFAFWAAPIRRVLGEIDVMLSIGGDNYCYEQPDYYFHVDRMVQQAGKPVVLWGASVDVRNASSQKIADLRAFDLITARESLTVENLKSIGVSETVQHVADPAFTLQATPVDATNYWPAGDGVLGFNVSPLLGRYHESAGSDVVLEAAKAAIRHSVDRLGMGVLLIPHVTRPMPAKEAWNDDAAFMQQLLHAVERPERVTIAPTDLDSTQFKHLISRCQFFVGARTHSTIAALSSCVPTVSIGYSVKALGINRDLFGHDRYVCNIKSMGPKDLVTAIDQLAAEHKLIRHQLASQMDQVKSRSISAADQLASLIGAKQ